MMIDCKQKRELIIIEHEPLTPRLKEAWMIDALISNGISISYWDLSAFTDKGLEYPNQVEASYVKHISTFEDFKAALKKTDVPKSLFFVEIVDGWSSLSIYKTLKSNQCVCLKYDFYASIAYPQKHKIFNRFKLIFTKTGFFFKSYILFNRIFKFFKYQDVFSPCSYRFRTIAVNHPDYEKYIASESYNQKDYFVFLDIYYPLHPDYSRFGGGTNDPQPYWDSMNRLFEKLEKKYHKEIIIAAHPKANYGKNVFNNRRIIVGKTCELVKGCDGVILHDSASINFAILANKPLFMCFTKEQLRPEPTRQSVNSLTSFIGLDKHILDCIEDDELVFSQIKPELRERFINNMLASEETKSLSNSDIISHYVKGI